MINKMLRLSFFPLIFRLMALAVFVLLVINGLSATSEDAVFLKILRNTNLANLIVWSYWWPLIIVAAVIFGRLWCFVCPVEMLTSFFAKIGLKKKRAGWLESGWGITLFYIIILFVGIQGLAVHRDPSRMAWYLIAIAGVSVISGLIFEKNTFCASICPIGHLLGLYARISPWGWRVKEPAICGSCKDKSCVHKDYTYNSISKSCGVYLLPEKLDDNTACILCSGCMKACNKYNPEKVEGRPNPGFRYIGFAKDLLKNKTLSMAETFFVLIVSGFVIYEILSEWNGTKQILMFLPKLLKNYFDIHSPVVIGLEKSTILFLLLPLLIVFIPFLVSRLARTARVAVSFKEYLVNYSIVLIPVMAAAHISKSLLKSISRIPYFEHIPKDLTGLSTAQEILDKTIVLDKIPSWLSWSATGAVTLLLLTGFVLSIKLTAIVNKKLFEEKGTAKVFYLLPLLYSGIFLITIIAWRYF